MRIALITHIRSRIGGTESYVEQLAAELHFAGHDVALWHEHDGPAGRGIIELPAGAPAWSVESLGAGAALDSLRRWQPDVLFSHGVSTPDVEASILDIGPTVMFVHAYHGACVSGAKSRLSPSRMPCPRPLGVPCLLHYLPRRCGGLNPATMIRRYLLETGRRDTLRRYAAIVTASSHMRNEYLKYHLPPDRVQVVGLMIPQGGHVDDAPATATAHSGFTAVSGRDLTREWRLLFVARLTNLKGGKTLLEAMSLLRSAFTGRIVLTVAGEGPERSALEQRATQLCATLGNIEIQFTGWLGSEALKATMRATDLLVVPSIWPEPYGLVGPEAGIHGVPAVAFAVGGIPDWLREGVNGHLAPGDPPTAAGLASAIMLSLSDPGHHAKLREGAVAQARDLHPAHHLRRIVDVLQRAAAPGNSRREVP